MRKKIVASVICLGVVLGLAGCNADAGKTEEQSTETKAVSDVTESDVTENKETKIAKPSGPVVQAEASEWSVAVETEYAFPSYLIGYYNENTALSIGYNGEIHYINAETQDWPAAENTSLCRFGMDIIDGTTCYTCGNGGHVTKSTDGGKTFTRVADFGGSEPSQCCMMSFCDENNGLIASASRLAITADGAATWTELTVPSGILAIRMETPEQFCYVGSDFNFYKTTDGGTTWDAVPMDLPLGDGYLSGLRNFTLSVDGDNMYSVFCIESETKTLKSYSTADGWISCTENKIPEMTGLEKAYIYLNQDGTMMTLTNASEKKAVAMEKQ